MSFKLPWVDGRDVKYLGQGHYSIECIWWGRTFVQNLILTLLLTGCAVCPEGDFANVTSYAVSPDTRTPKGIQVDTSGQYLDLGEVDRRVDEVEACLRAKFPDGILPTEMMSPGHCLTNRIRLTVDRACLKVKVAPDWHVSCTGGMQVFPCGVDPQLCLDKGITPTPECPCECRSAIQDQDTIVTTPDLHLFENDLLRIQTTCNFIWVPGLQECFTG